MFSNSYLRDTFDGALYCVPLLRLFSVHGYFEGAFFDDGLVVGGSDIFRIVDDSGNSRFIPLSCLFGIRDLSCGQYLRNVLEGGAVDVELEDLLDDLCFVPINYG